MTNHHDETPESAMWDSEKRSSPYSTVANPEDEWCEVCENEGCDCCCEEVAQSATHERCGTADCRVREQFTQATRHEPMRSLGFSGYCPTCDVSFAVQS